LNPALPLGIPILPPHQPHPLHSSEEWPWGRDTEGRDTERSEKLKDTERSEHTAYPPRPVPYPGPTPNSHNTWNNPSFEFFCSAKETYFVLQRPRFCFFCLKTHKKSEREIRKKHYFPGHFDGLDQLLFAIENDLFIKWRPGIINSK